MQPRNHSPRLIDFILFRKPMISSSATISRLFLLLGFALLILPSGFGQHGGSKSGKNNLILVPCVIVDGDTFLYNVLPTFHFFSPKVFKNKKEKEHYYKLVYNVKKVYPYARLAGIKLREYNTLMLDAKTEKARKNLMKQAEDDLEKQFGKELRKLTFSQGIILLKLIDRETGQSGYELVSELRGAFRAFFWQGIGKLFGYNLRMQYDPLGTDKEIEEIVLKIMYGQL